MVVSKLTVPIVWVGVFWAEERGTLSMAIPGLEFLAVVRELSPRPETARAFAVALLIAVPPKSGPILPVP